MRTPLALKVSAWLLLNLALLAALAALFIGVRSGGLGWNSLVEGPPGRRAQDLAEATAGELRPRSRDQREAYLAEFSQRHGVDVALLAFDGRTLVGTLGNIPSPLVDLIRNAPPAPLPPDQDRRPPPLGPEAGPPSPAAPAPPHGNAAGGLPQRLLLHTGEPRAYWLGVRVGGPGRPPALLVVRSPDLFTLLRLLDVTSWLWAAAVGIVVSLLFWLPFVRGLTRDLKRLERATQAVADGRFDDRVPETRRDELGSLGASVNRMAARLDRLVAGQKRFLGDIAHELGSPLGRMQVGASILEDRAAPELQPNVADLREEIDHMAGLVNELLAFTKAGLRPRDASLALVELAPLAARVIAREAADDAVTVSIPHHLAVRADSDLLSRALGNLIRNALRHAGRDANITLRAAPADATHAEIVVEDTGPGVPADALARLGEPLFRPEVARSRDTGGTGLGLAITKSCIEACGGTVTFANRTPRGLRVTLRLSLVPPE